MARRRTKVPAPKPESREQIAARIADTLPAEEAGICAAAKRAQEDCHAAILAGDEGAAREASQRFEACVWKLNGGGFFGCRAGDDASGNRLAAHCAAPAGERPAWGQAGAFLVVVEGVRAVAEVTPYGLDFLRYSASFHLVDPGRPFISETGYRSHFFDAVAGITLAEAVEREFAALIRSQGLVAPRPRFPRPLPDWLQDLAPLDPREAYRVEPGGQQTFGF